MSEKTVEELQREMLQLELDTKRFELEQRVAAAEEKPPTKGKDDAGAAADAKAAAEAKAAEREAALAARLSAVSTELGKVTAPALTLPDTVFRQREITAAALIGAAAQAADTIATAAVAAPVLVTGRTDQARAVIAARSFLLAVTTLRSEAESLLEREAQERERRRALEATGGEKTSEGEAGLDAETDSTETEPAATPTDPIAAAAALAVTALTLLSVETTVTASSGTATELETHVPVLRHLLERQVPVLHETLGIPGTDNAVLTEFAALAPLAVALDALVAAKAEAITRLGKDVAEEKVAPLLAVKSSAQTLSTAIVTFVTGATKPDATTGESPLTSAALAARLIAGQAGDAAFVAVVLPARTDAHQVSLKRRLAASRLVVSASATIDVVVIEVADGTVKAAATHTDARSFQVRFPMWFWPWGPQVGLRSSPQLTALPDPPLFEVGWVNGSAGALRPPVSQAPQNDMNPPLT